jgi:hypothetical protein
VCGDGGRRGRVRGGKDIEGIEECVRREGGETVSEEVRT